MTPAPARSASERDAVEPHASERYAIIPQPRRLVAGAGEFRLDRETRVVLSGGASASLRALAELLVAPLRAASGLPLPIAPASERESSGDGAANAIVLRLDEGPPPAFPESEGYRLVVSGRGATLSAATPAGLLHGVMTVRQLLPADIERAVRSLAPWRADHGRTAAVPAAPARWAIPAVEIEDAPRFRYRGILLDVGRYYLPPEFLKKIADVLALYKFNRLHLHLTDDQGWRLEIRKYPRLTSVGAWRKETMVAQNFDPYVGDGKRHGGFYTQQQVRDLVAYAAARGVTIVPEIEMPGHTGAAIAAYPELACAPGPFEVSTKWGVHEEVVCPSERTIAFFEDVLTEVMELFPSEYIHIGGDEVPKTRWKASPVAQEIMRREGLASEEELQSWFTKRIERFLRAHGRRLIGWDEILEGGIAPEATVMSWRGTQGGIDAARQGHDVVMSPGDHAYLDFYQGDPATEPLAICCYLPLDSVYAWEPVPPELTPAEARHVLGAQGNLWGEYVSTPAHAEYMLFPRMLALSELFWSPKEARDRDRFYAQLAAHIARLDAIGVEYRVPEPAGMASDRKVLEGRTSLTMASPVPGGVVRYTTDGSDPTASSPRYAGPIPLDVTAAPATVSARVFLPNGRASPPARMRVARATWQAAVAVRAEALRPGLAYTYSEGDFTAADDVRQRPATRAGTIAEVRLRGDERPEQYGIRLTGLLRVPEDALYTFHLASDDGAKLRVDGELVVDHDGQHATTEKQGQAALRAGLHALELTYFQGPGGADLRLELSADGLPRRPVPKEWLVHEEEPRR
jgi:hexosaminidase